MHGTGVIDVDHTYPVTELAFYEQPNITLDVLDDALGCYGRAESGYNVTHDSAFRVSAVWQAVTRISGDVAKLPIHLYRRDEDGSRSEDMSHPAHRLARRRPNNEMGAFKFWRRMMVHQLIWNNAYAFIVLDRRNQPSDLLPLLPDRTQPHRVGDVLVYNTEVDGELVAVPATRIIHLEGICVDNIAGMDVTKYARDSWGLALASQGFASKFFRRGGRVGGTLEVPATMTPRAVKNLEEGFTKTYDDADAAFRTVVLKDNAKFHTAQRSFVETQLVEGRRESVRDVARYFNIAPGKLGEESSVSYGSKSEDNRDYLDTTLSPHLCMIAEEVGFKLLAEREQETHYFEHNTAALLRMNTLEQYQTGEIGVRSMVLTRNEFRKTQNLPPLEGGDEVFNPNISEQPSEDVDRTAQAHASLFAKTARDVLNVVGNKAKRAAGSGKMLEWVTTKLPGERDLIDRAIRPVAHCISAARCQEGEDLADSMVNHLAGLVETGCEKIVSDYNETDYRDQVAELFDRLVSKEFEVMI